jgi:hypothetical protein
VRCGPTLRDNMDWHGLCTEKVLLCHMMTASSCTAEHDLQRGLWCAATCTVVLQCIASLLACDLVEYPPTTHPAQIYLAL